MKIPAAYGGECALSRFKVVRKRYVERLMGKASIIIILWLKKL
jgi:hypothetical protein